MRSQRLSRIGIVTTGIVWATAVAISGYASPPDTSYVESIETWRRDREVRLASDDGWLTLAGLFWLSEGENSFGSDSSNDLIFSDKAAPRIGRFILEPDRVRVEVERGVPVLHDGQPVRQLDLVSDADGQPTILSLGDLSFYIIKRGEKRAIRLKDRNHPERLSFHGIESFPVDHLWRISARFEPHEPVHTIPIPTVLGTVTEQASWGSVAFVRDGREHRLDVLAEPGDERLFIIFADKTTARETYGGGRYLYADAPGPDGTVVLDFNKAYNPPCAFTAFATCPLPPRQNRLALRVEAGEKTYSKER